MCIMKAAPHRAHTELSEPVLSLLCRPPPPPPPPPQLHTVKPSIINARKHARSCGILACSICIIQESTSSFTERCDHSFHGCRSLLIPCHLPFPLQFFLARDLPAASVRVTSLFVERGGIDGFHPNRSAVGCISELMHFRSSGGIPKFLLPLDDRRVSLIAELSRKVLLCSCCCRINLIHTFIQQMLSSGVSRIYVGT
jgi:hypothetical protein